MNPAQKRINGVFLLFTCIKLLITLLLKFWMYPVAALLTLLGAENVGGALSTLASGSEPTGLLFGITLYIAAVSLPLALYGTFSSEGTGTMTRRPALPECVCAVGVTMTVTVFVSMLYYIVFGLITRSVYFSAQIDVPSLSGNDPASITLFILYLCVLPAMSEEFLIRGAGINALRGMKRGFVIFITALCFMMLHSSLSNIVYAFTAGLMMSYFAFKFKSVWLTVIIHFFLNLNSAILQMLSASLSSRETAFGYMLYCLIAAIFCIGATIAYPIIYGIRLPREEISVPQPEERASVFKSPFFYTFTLIFLADTAVSVINLITAQ